MIEKTSHQKQTRPTTMFETYKFPSYKERFKVAIQKLNFLIDKLGIENAWYSILATHIYKIHQPRFDYLLKQKEPFPSHQIKSGLTLALVWAIFLFGWLSCRKTPKVF